MLSTDTTISFSVMITNDVIAVGTRSLVAMSQMIRPSPTTLVIDAVTAAYMQSGPNPQLLPTHPMQLVSAPTFADHPHSMAMVVSRPTDPWFWFRPRNGTVITSPLPMIILSVKGRDIVVRGALSWPGSLDPMSLASDPLFGYAAELTRDRWRPPLAYNSRPPEVISVSLATMKALWLSNDRPYAVDGVSRSYLAARPVDPTSPGALLDLGDIPLPRYTLRTHNSYTAVPPEAVEKLDGVLMSIVWMIVQGVTILWMRTKHGHVDCATIDSAGAVTGLNDTAQLGSATCRELVAWLKANQVPSCTQYGSPVSLECCGLSNRPGWGIGDVQYAVIDERVHGILPRPPLVSQLTQGDLAKHEMEGFMDHAARTKNKRPRYQQCAMLQSAHSQNNTRRAFSSFHLGFIALYYTHSIDPSFKLNAAELLRAAAFDLFDVVRILKERQHYTPVTWVGAALLQSPIAINSAWKCEPTGRAVAHPYSAASRCPTRRLTAARLREAGRTRSHLPLTERVSFLEAKSRRSHAMARRSAMESATSAAPVAGWTSQQVRSMRAGFVPAGVTDVPAPPVRRPPATPASKPVTVNTADSESDDDVLSVASAAASVASKMSTSSRSTAVTINGGLDSPKIRGLYRGAIEVDVKSLSAGSCIRLLAEARDHALSGGDAITVASIDCIVSSICVLRGSGPYYSRTYWQGEFPAIQRGRYQIIICSREPWTVPSKRTIVARPPIESIRRGIERLASEVVNDAPAYLPDVEWPMPACTDRSLIRVIEPQRLPVVEYPELRGSPLDFDFRQPPLSASAISVRNKIGERVPDHILKTGYGPRAGKHHVASWEPNSYVGKAREDSAFARMCDLFSEMVASPSLFTAPIGEVHRDSRYLWWVTTSTAVSIAPSSRHQIVGSRSPLAAKGGSIRYVLWRFPITVTGSGLAAIDRQRFLAHATDYTINCDVPIVVQTKLAARLSGRNYIMAWHVTRSVTLPHWQIQVAPTMEECERDLFVVDLIEPYVISRTLERPIASSVPLSDVVLSRLALYAAAVNAGVRLSAIKVADQRAQSVTYSPAFHDCWAPASLPGTLSVLARLLYQSCRVGAMVPRVIGSPNSGTSAGTSASWARAVVQSADGDAAWTFPAVAIASSAFNSTQAPSGVYRASAAAPIWLVASRTSRMTRPYVAARTKCCVVLPDHPVSKDRAAGGAAAASVTGDNRYPGYQTVRSAIKGRAPAIFVGWEAPVEIPAGSYFIKLLPGAAANSSLEDNPGMLSSGPSPQDRVSAVCRAIGLILCDKIKWARSSRRTAVLLRTNILLCPQRPDGPRAAEIMNHVVSVFERAMSNPVALYVDVVTAGLTVVSPIKLDPSWSEPVATVHPSVQPILRALGYTPADAGRMMETGSIVDGVGIYWNKHANPALGQPSAVNITPIGYVVTNGSHPVAHLRVGLAIYGSSGGTGFIHAFPQPSRWVVHGGRASDGYAPLPRIDVPEFNQNVDGEYRVAVESAHDPMSKTLRCYGLPRLIATYPEFLYDPISAFRDLVFYPWAFPSYKDVPEWIVGRKKSSELPLGLRVKMGPLFSWLDVFARRAAYVCQSVNEKASSWSSLSDRQDARADVAARLAINDQLMRGADPIIIPDQSMVSLGMSTNAVPVRPLPPVTPGWVNVTRTKADVVSAVMYAYETGEWVVSVIPLKGSIPPAGSRVLCINAHLSEYHV